VIALARAILRRGFELIERPFERLFGPALNPLAQLGALGFFFFWIVAVSGIYLFIFFNTGIERAYESVEHLTRDYWFHAGVMRSFHRYASDLLVVMIVVHLLREFAYDHYRGVRWFSWLTGLPIIWLLYLRNYRLLAGLGQACPFCRHHHGRAARLAPDLRRADRAQFHFDGHAHQPVLHPHGVHARGGAAFSPIHHVGAYSAHLAAESESATDVGGNVVGRARRCFAVESGAIARSRRSDNSAGRGWARLVLLAGLSADQYLGTRRRLGFSRRIFAHDRVDAMAAAVAAGEACRS